MGSSSSKASYPVTYNGQIWNLTQDSQNLIFSQATPSKKWPVGCNALLTSTETPGSYTYSLNCPNENQVTNLSNCAVPDGSNKTNQLICPIAENLDSINQIKAQIASLETKSYQEQPSRSNLVWFLLLLFFFLILGIFFLKQR